MARLIARLIAAQDRWAAPFGDFNHRWLTALFRPMTPVKDLLNGRWLGHPVHPALTDIPIGAFTVAIVLDVVGHGPAALWAIVVGQVTYLAATITGLADYADASGPTRTRATTHGIIMLVGGALTAASLAVRASGGESGALALGLLVVGFLVITAGAYVGGDLVFSLGSMVSRHAFRGPGTKWVRLDLVDVSDLAALPEGTPIKARAGINDVVLVRTGDAVQAIHAVCAHAGGPLDKGALVDGCIECPWHASRFRLADGRVVRGPAVYDQPAYEIRAADGGGYEARRAAS
jgi:nitrite reductase/ring-hydroxylating ferredoxin subunit/uncharacterized membrane protein